jgi:hypothetical protein
MELNAIHQTRAAQTGRSKGMIWMVSVTAFFAVFDLYFAKLRVFATLTVAVVVFAITIVLFIWSLKTLRLAKLLPDDKSADAVKRSSALRKWFIIIITLEIAGFNVAPIVLWKLNYLQYVIPADILIAALHFIPLEGAFLQCQFITHMELYWL